VKHLLFLTNGFLNDCAHPVVYRTEVWSIGIGRMSGVKSGVLWDECSCARVVHWKVKVTSSLTDVWQQLFEQQDITVIVLCTIHFHPCLHENHTTAPAPGDTDWNRNAETCLSETSEVCPWAEMASDWNSRQPAELHWSIDTSVTRLFYCVSQSQKQTLWTFAVMCFSMICNCHDF